MSNGVLPSRWSVAVVRKLPHHPVVDLLDGEGLGRGALDGHEDHAGEAERRLDDVPSVVFPIAGVQDHVDHLIRASRGPGAGALRSAFAELGLSGPSSDRGTHWLGPLLLLLLLLLD